MRELNITFRSPEEVLDFIKKVEKYPFNMDLSRGSVVVDAKSLLGILNLGLNQVVSLKVYAIDEECVALCDEIQPYLAA